MGRPASARELQPPPWPGVSAPRSPRGGPNGGSARSPRTSARARRETAPVRARPGWAASPGPGAPSRSPARRGPCRPERPPGAGRWPGGPAPARPWARRRSCASRLSTTSGSRAHGRAENWARSAVRAAGLPVSAGMTGCSALTSLIEAATEPRKTLAWRSVQKPPGSSATALPARPRRTSSSTIRAPIELPTMSTRSTPWLVEERLHRAGERVDGVLAGQRRGRAEARQVHRQDIPVGGEDVDHRVPGAVAASQSVDQQQRVASASAYGVHSRPIPMSGRSSAPS